MIRLMGLGCAMVVLSGGCAKHADFVELREEVTALHKAFDQDHKRQETVQRRLQSLETKMGVKPVQGDDTLKALERMPQQLQELTARVKDLESRLARVGENAGTPAGASRTDEAPAPRPSKPSKGSEGGEAAPLVAGTPALTPTSAFNLAYND